MANVPTTTRKPSARKNKIQGNTATPFGESRFLSSSEVMRALAYTDKSAFWTAVKSSGIPHIRVNQRKILFEEKAVNSWLRSRTVGFVPRGGEAA